MSKRESPTSLLAFLRWSGKRSPPVARFQEDLDADSLEVVDMIMSVEDAFDIEIADEKAETLRTVGDLIAFIKTKQNA